MAAIIDKEQSYQRLAKRELDASCNSGDLNRVKSLNRKYGYTVQIIRQTNCLSLYLACSSGNIELVQWLVYEFGLTPDDAIISTASEEAIKKGNLKLTQWMIEYFGLTSERPFMYACSFSQLEIAKWLVKHFNLTKEYIINDEKILKIVCLMSKVEVLEWLVEQILQLEDKQKILAMLNWACAQYSVDNAQWIIGRFNLTREDIISSRAIKTAHKLDHIGTLQMFIEFGVTQDDIDSKYHSMLDFSRSLGPKYAAKV